MRIFKNPNVLPDNITIDITYLSPEELEWMESILYHHGSFDEIKQLRDRMVFTNGWLNDEDEIAYRNRFIKDEYKKELGIE